MLTVTQILIDGGGTYSLDGTPVPSTGYFVSVPDRTLTVPATVITQDILEAYAETVPAGLLLGGWVNKGLVYLDATEHFADREEAIAEGIDRNQLAIWDIENGEEIEL